MWNEILNDLWRVYRGRLLGSVFGLFIGAMKTCLNGWTGCCRPATINN